MSEALFLNDLAAASVSSGTLGLIGTVVYVTVKAVQNKRNNGNGYAKQKQIGELHDKINLHEREQFKNCQHQKDDLMQRIQANSINIATIEQYAKDTKESLNKIEGKLDKVLDKK